MTHFQDPDRPSEQQGSEPKERPKLSDSPLPMEAFSLTLNLLTAFLDLSPDALIISDVAGTIVSVNMQMEMLFGYDKDELIGQLVEFLLPESLRATHVAQRAQYLQAARTRSMGIGLELIGQRKDGSQMPIAVSLRPILIEHTLHVMSAIRDVSEQHRLMERLQQQDKLIRMAHDAILVRDPESRILSWNEGAEHLYGWTAQEVRGWVTHTLLQTRFPVSLEEVDHTLEEHGQWEGELIHTCRDGRQVIVESRHVLTRDEQGRPTAILEINRDITERRRLMERLQQQDKLISMAHDAILVRDLEGHIVSWNEGAEHLYGWTAQEARGKEKHMLLQTCFPISLEAVNHTLEEHGQWEGELIHTCRDGRQVIVESRQVLTCDVQGRPTAILEINRDVTERRRLMERLP